MRRHGGMACDEFCGVLRCSVEEVMTVNSDCLEWSAYVYL